MVLIVAKMRKIATTSTRNWAIISMICPVLVLLVSNIAPLFTNNDDLIKVPISNLALGRYSWVGATLFALTGVMLLSFVRGLSRSLLFDNKFRTAHRLLNASAFCFLLMVLIPKESVLEYGFTVQRVLHNTIASTAILFFVLACLRMIKSLRQDTRWRRMCPYTMVVALTTIVLGTVVSIVLFLHTWWMVAGLLERLALVNGVVWVELMSIRMYQLSRR
jgi:hypothetical protein